MQTTLQACRPSRLTDEVPQFDAYSGEYEALVDRSISFVPRSHAFFIEAKASRMLSLLSAYSGDPSEKRVLDIGCGAGMTHAYLGPIGRLEAVDVSGTMIERAREQNPGVLYRVGDALKLPFANDTFDAVSAITVLHHIAPEHWPACLGEMNRVLRKDGLAIIFEHNPFNPLTRVAVSRCEFDDDAVLLSASRLRRLMESQGFATIESRHILLTPWRNRVALGVERAMSRFPLGAQYYVVGRSAGK
jgi:SAM-dependent methyltransferase